jgi:hypothetical protein
MFERGQVSAGRCGETVDMYQRRLVVSGVAAEFLSSEECDLLEYHHSPRRHLTNLGSLQ